jgi:hypothetical protein
MQSSVFHPARLEKIAVGAKTKKPPGNREASSQGRIVPTEA